MLLQLGNRMVKQIHTVLVNTGNRLIQKEQVRLIHNRHGQQYTLQFTTGQIAHLFINQIFCLKNCQMFFYFCIYFFALFPENRITALVACDHIIHTDRCLFFDIQRLRHITDLHFLHVTVFAVFELNSSAVRNITKNRLDQR